MPVKAPRVRVVFLDAATLPRTLAFDRSTLEHIDYHAYQSTDAEQLGQRIDNAEIVITNKVRLDARILGAAARSLRLVCVAAAGTDNIDLDAAAANGIAVRNMPGYADESVAEHVIATLFALRRQLASYTAGAHDGRWSAAGQFCWHGPRIRELARSTLGIVGRGRIGETTARLARGLGMQVHFAQSPRRAKRDDELPMDTLFAQCDALSLHCPLNAATRAIVDARRLATMRSDAVLINTGRGALVDPHALAAALRAGRIAGAAIDVLDPEPPPPDHPLLATDIPNLLLTPHVAWASDAAQARLAARLVEAVTTHLRARS